MSARPSVLLLDEPMAALDVQTAVLIRQLLREQLTTAGTTAILVTHDVLDAIVLADWGAILQEGRVVDVGEKSRVLPRPRNQFIAALAGLNHVYGVADAAGHLSSPAGRQLTGRTEDGIPLAASTAAAVFSPTAVKVHTAEPPIDAGLNRWVSTVAALEPSTVGIRVRTADDDDLIAQLPPVRAAELNLAAAQPIWLSTAVADVALHTVD